MKRVLLLLLTAFCVAAHAQSYPAKPVRLIIPYPPGGGNSELVGNSPEEFAAFVRAELDKYARIIKAAGIKLD